MLSILLLIYLVRCASADETVEIIPRCSDFPGTRMTFTPLEGYQGRYSAELCTERNSSYKEWELLVYIAKTRNHCNSSHSLTKLVSGSSHSSNVEWISSEHNCTEKQTVCMSAQFDMIFSACYVISSRFLDRSAPPSYFFFNVTNPYTEEYFHKNHAIVDVVYHRNDTTVTWHPGVAPSVYKVEVCNQTDLNSCEPVPNCVTSDKLTIKCTVDGREGCYKMYLWHEAPWIRGIFYKQESMSYHFCRNSSSVVAEVSGSAWGWWAWLGAALAAGCALGGCAARALRQALANSNKQKEVLRRWLVHRSEEAGEEGVKAAGAGAGAGHVLLLYARQGAHAARAVAALTRALRHALHGQVYDIYSPYVAAASAAAPGAWLRALVSRRDVRVLLLQSPALHATHATYSQPDHIHLTGPLLGRRVRPRTPHFGDALLTYALRLATETLREPDDYNKYYVATISDLPTEMLPCLVPYRRYALPAATPLLLRDLASPSPSASPSDPPCPPCPPCPHHLIDDFTTLLNEFVHYATDNPDYLMEELMLVDS